MTLINPNLFGRTGDEDYSSYIKALIAGAPKSGKTHLLGTVPGILVCDTEPFANNMETLRTKDVPVATIRSIQDLMDVAIVLGNDTLRQQMAQQRYGMDDIKAVAIDTMDTLQKIMKLERMASERRRTFEQSDWGWLKTEMERVVTTFNSLPMHTFFTVHLKTTEIGAGVDRTSKVEPGLEGAIAASIAGMVGYSMLTFRKDDVDPQTGQIKTHYYLRTEGNQTHDFLGTRVGELGLPPVIEPDMGTIHAVIMEGKKRVAEARAARAALPPATELHYPEQPAPGVQGTLPPNYQPAPPVPPVTTAQVQATQQLAQAAVQQPAQQVKVSDVAPTERAPAEQPVQTVAQNVSQDQPVQTPVPTSEQPVQQVQPAPQPAPQSAVQPPQGDRPGDDAPVNVAAIGHLKKIYDAIRQPFPETLFQGKTMGEAREISAAWRAILADHNEGKAEPGHTAEQDMIELLTVQGYLQADAPPEPPTPAALEAPTTLDITAPIKTIQAYIGNPPDLARVQETYDAESVREKPRSSLLAKLVELGAVPPAPPAPPAPEADEWEYPAPEGQQPPAASEPVAPPVEQPTAQPEPVVQTPVQTPEQPVTPSAPATDTSNTGAPQGAVVTRPIQAGDPCTTCGNPIVDVDLAVLGSKRWDGEVLCVDHYINHPK